MKDSTEMYTCGLEMKGGLASNIDYPADYMHAPKSQFPSTPTHPGKQAPSLQSMMKTMT